MIASVVRELPEDHEIQKDYTIFELTKIVLKEHPVYSELVEDNIERWNANREKVKKKPGRKVNSDFEAAIWGKLMICEYEKVEVRSSHLFVCVQLNYQYCYQCLHFCKSVCTKIRFLI